MIQINTLIFVETMLYLKVLLISQDGTTELKLGKEKAHTFTYE